MNGKLNRCCVGLMLLALSLIKSFAISLLVDPFGRIYVAGSFQSSGGDAMPGFGRLNPDGSADKSFDVGVRPQGRSGVRHISAMAFSPNGNQILIGGDLDSYDHLPTARLASIHLDPVARVASVTSRGGNVLNLRIQSQPNVRYDLFSSDYLTEWHRVSSHVADQWESTLELTMPDSMNAQFFHVNPIGFENEYPHE